jgi:hypothetical protein
MVVVGAQVDRDLDLVRETLTDASIFGIKVLVLGDSSAVHVPGVPEWHLPGNVEDLHGALQKLHAPIAQDQFAWSIRLGSGRVTLAPAEAAKISRRFALITESDLARPSKVDLSSVESFFRAVVTDWRPSRTTTGHKPWCLRLKPKRAVLLLHWLFVRLRSFWEHARCFPTNISGTC